MIIPEYFRMREGTMTYAEEKKLMGLLEQREVLRGKLIKIQDRQVIEHDDDQMAIKLREEIGAVTLEIASL